MKGVKHDWIIRETKPDGDIYVIRESTFDSGAKHAEVLCYHDSGGFRWAPTGKEAESGVAFFLSLEEAAKTLAYYGDELCGQ